MKMERSMKKHNLIAATGALSLIIGLLSFTGASAEDSNKNSGDNKSNSNNSSQEFKGSGARSHGHPVANSIGAPAAGSQEDQSSFVSNDDANAELNWQQWNKANGKATAKALNSIASNPITYHKTGALKGMPYFGNVQLIPVWVGNWDATGASGSRREKWNTFLSNLVTSLGGSGSINLAGHVLNTNGKYFTLNPPNQSVPNLTWPNGGGATIPATGTLDRYKLISVSDANVARYITTAISKLPALATGVKPMYVYIGASNTRLSSGFGTAYCGWHSIGTLGASNIPYIAIQDYPSTFNSACTTQALTPNGDVPLDSMSSVLVHEIDEALTDTDLRTWYDSKGAENADKCAWTFSTPATPAGFAALPSATNGSKYNFTTLNGTKYLIQRNWLADNLVKDVSNGTACALTN